MFDSQKQENTKGAGPSTVDGACLPRVTKDGDRGS